MFKVYEIEQDRLEKFLNSNCYDATRKHLKRKTSIISITKNIRTFEMEEVFTVVLYEQG